MDKILRVVDGRLDLAVTLSDWIFYSLVLAVSYALIISMLFPAIAGISAVV